MQMCRSDSFNTSKPVGSAAPNPDPPSLANRQSAGTPPAVYAGVSRRTLPSVVKRMQDRGSTVQRRVLTVGPVDTEVAIAQEYLAQSTALFPEWGESVLNEMAKFEQESKLLETEIFVGHGSPQKLGEMDVPTFVEAIKPKLDLGKKYSFTFFACQVGKKIPASENKSYATKVADELRRDNYQVTITSPENLVFVVGQNSFVEGNPFGKDVESPISAQTLTLYKNAFKDTVESLIDGLSGDLANLWKNIDDSIGRDIKTLQGRGVKSAKLPKPKSASVKDHFKTVLKGFAADPSQSKTVKTIETRLEWVMKLETYKTLVESANGISYGDLMKMLESRYRRNLLYPEVVRKLENTNSQATLVKSLPDSASEGWHLS